MKQIVGYAIALLLLSPLALWAQTAKPTKPAALATVTSTPTSTIVIPPTATATVDENLKEKEVKDIQDQIIDLTDQRADTELEFRRLARVYVEDLLRDKAAAAKRARNKKKYNEIMKQIADWDTLRQKEWQDDRDLIDKKAMVRKLERDHLRRIGQRVEVKLKENGLTERVDSMEAGLHVLDEIQDIDDQEVTLEKQLYTARENYDYKAADEVRVELKDVQKKYNDLAKQSNEKLKELREENPKDVEQQNL